MKSRYPKEESGPVELFISGKGFDQINDLASYLGILNFDESTVKLQAFRTGQKINNVGC